MGIRIYGNREIKTLAGRETRPTTAKVREAVFSIWKEKIVGAKWLDLCAGSGTMGAEALCRGAREVVAIEKSPLACDIIRENWQKIATPHQKFRILRGDVLKRLKSLRGEKFDLIYFDPPYHLNLYNPVIQAISDYELLNPESGELAVEYHPKESPLHPDSPLLLLDTRIYGDTAINFYSLGVGG